MKFRIFLISLSLTACGKSGFQASTATQQSSTSLVAPTSGSPASTGTVSPSPAVPSSSAGTVAPTSGQVDICPPAAPARPGVAAVGGTCPTTQPPPAASTPSGGSCRIIVNGQCYTGSSPTLPPSPAPMGPDPVVTPPPAPCAVASPPPQGSGIMCEAFSVRRSDGQMCPSYKCDSPFLNVLYTGLLGRAPDAGGKAYWMDEINRGRTTCAQLARNFVNSTDFQSAVLTDEEYLNRIYAGLLNRAPDAGGYSYWYDALVGGYPRANLAESVILSTEFEALCKSMNF